MNVGELKSQIENVTGLDHDLDYVIEVFNECLRESLVDVLRLETAAYADLTEKEQRVAWPADIYELLGVKLESEGFVRQVNLDDDDKVGFVLFGGELSFKNCVKPTDKCTVYYYRYPAWLDPEGDESQEPDMPSEYRHALKYYFLATYQLEDEDLELSQHYWERFVNIRAQIDEHTRRKKGMHRKRQVRARPWF